MDDFVRVSWGFTSRAWQVLLGACLLLTLGMAARRRLSAEEATALMERRIRTAIRERRLTADLEGYLTYLNGRLDASAGTNTFSDKTGNCRLPWVDRILRNPLEAPAEAERFSRKIHETLARPTWALEATIPLLMTPMGVSMTPPVRRKPKSIAGWEFAWWTSIVQRIATTWADAWAGIPEPERDAFLGSLVKQALGTNELGHRFASVTEGQAVCDRLEFHLCVRRGRRRGRLGERDQQPFVPRTRLGRRRSRRSLENKPDPPERYTALDIDGRLG